MTRLDGWLDFLSYGIWPMLVEVVPTGRCHRVPCRTSGTRAGLAGSRWSYAGGAGVTERAAGE